MTTVIALSSFHHYGPRRRNEEFSVSDDHAKALERAGLVRIKQGADKRALRSKGKSKK